MQESLIPKLNFNKTSVILVLFIASTLLTSCSQNLFGGASSVTNPKDSQCIDSDTGIRPEIYGTVKWIKGGVSFYDSCIDDYTLREGYCDGVNPRFTNINCTGEYNGCEEGKCI